MAFIGTAASGPANVQLEDLNGDGTGTSPYEITNASELQAIEQDLGANYTLINDIDASGTAAWNDDKGFKPIGTDDGTYFAGSLDGQNHTIDGLRIDRSTEGNVGLFGTIDGGAIIENVQLESIEVTGDSRVGGLVGWSAGDSPDEIRNVHVEGSVTATGDAGGLIGSNWQDATVSESSTNVTVTSTAGSVGGLVGWGEFATISDTYALGDVSGGDRVGGLIGHHAGTIERSYAAGTVGGANEDKGGLIGKLNGGGDISDSYWDTDITGETDAVGVDDSGSVAATGLATGEMQGERPLGTMDSLGFYDAWVPTAGYPDLLSPTGVEGDGSADSPYTVANVYQLQAIEKNLDAEYKLVADIDASDTQNWNNGDGFEPIGDRNSIDGNFDGTPFTGTFDGQSHEIADLYIDRPGQNYIGLFAAAAYTGPTAATDEPMIIQNIRLENVTITGKAGVSPHGPDSGGVAGLLGGIDTNNKATNARVENVSVEGNISAAGGSYNVGGVVATTAELVGGDGHGAVLDNQNVFVGTISAPDVDQVGGIIGRTSHAGTTVGTGYAQADITGNNQVGGIVGHTSNAHSTFEELYFAGTVTGTSDVGGIAGRVGNDGADFPNTYWDDEIGPEDGFDTAGGTVDTEPIGLSTDQMQGEAAETNMNGFDWVDTWVPTTFPEDDYPVFAWQLVSDEFVYSDLSVSTTELAPGDELIVTATLTNEGDEELPYSAPLKINGSTVDSQAGSLAAGEATELTFTRQLNDEGEFDVTVGDLDSVTVTVSEDFESEPIAVQTGSGDAEFVETTGPVTVWPALTITNGDGIEGATVSIVDGYDSSTDELGFDESFADEKNINGTVDGSRLTFINDGSPSPAASDYQAVLRTVTYNNTETDPLKSDRNIAVSLTEGTGTVLYNPATGNYYEHVTDESITWDDARANAESRSYFDKRGYLTTITSKAENDFLRDEFEAGGWIGASDAAEESIWRWVTGPEGLADGGQGQHFFTQTAGHVAGFGPYAGAKRGNVGGGEAVDGAYNNWNPRHEPNNKFPQFGGQDYGYLCAGPGSCPDGMWKDASANSPPFDADGYFVEYGGLPSDSDTTPAGDRTVTITPNTPPTADAGTDIETEVDAEIEFDGSASSDVVGIDGYRWAFGDGTVYGFDPVNATVTYSYDTDGEYTATLTVSDTTGQTATDEIGVTVVGPAILIANAGANETVDEGETVSFDASGSEASEGIASFEWAFGEGSTASGQTASHSYDDPGTYTATLTVTDSEGNEATATKRVTVEDTTPPETVAGVDGPATVGQGETITLDAGGSTPTFSDIATYEWDTDGNGGINETGETVEISYEEAGNYTVTLYATDTAGNTGTDTVTITVEDTTDPIADAGEDISAVVGERISFDGTNSTDNVGIDTLSWEFGDSTTADGSTVTHTYSSEDTYEVTLTATDFAGNTDTDTLTVTVTDPPEITATGGETAFRQFSGPIVVDDTVTIDSADTFEGAEVSIDSGFDAESDVLGVTATPDGIIVTYNQETGVLSLEGEASAEEYQSALRNVTYDNTASNPDESDRTITFTLGTGSLYNPGTGNYYEFVSDSGISWFDAREAAADRTHFGLRGYLATIRSAEENAFIAEKIDGQGWIGASDRATESEWHWVTGPEGEQTDGEFRGVHFFDQTSTINGEPQSVYGGATPGGGDPVDGAYNNWASGEPNHWYGGEDFAHYYADGTWNDYAFDNEHIDGYIVEYGGFNDDPAVKLSDNRTVTVSADRPPVAKAFGSNETTVGEGLNFTAANSTDDHGIYGYGWDFGDGTVYPVDPTNESVSHSYSEDGSYTVTLTVEDIANQTATATLNVTVIDDTFVIANPGANVTVDQHEPVTLNASGSQASDGIDSYEWDFTGDGEVDKTGKEVTFEGYGEHGTKPVELNVTDTRGNSSITTTYVHVTDISPPEAVAGANVTVDNENLTVDEGDVVEFNATDTVQNGTALVDYEWTFPQFPGGQATKQTGETVSYEFSPGSQPGPGTFPVTLAVTDEAGNTNTTSLSVTVTDTTPPTADAGTDMVVERGEQFSFDASRSTDNVAIESYNWSLPDSLGNLTGVAPTHTFDATGTYNVSLTVTDTSEFEATDSVLVLVRDTTPPTIQSFTVSNPSDQLVEVTLTSDEPLADLVVDLTGPESTELTRGSFGESQDNGTFTYTTTYEASTNGEYEATLTSATDEAGNDGATGQSGNATLTTPPVIDADDVSITNPDDRELDISVAVDQPLSTIEMTLTRDGTPVETFEAADFEEIVTDDGYRYTTSYTADEDGTFELVLDRAENVNGEDGATGQSATAVLNQNLVAEITASSSIVTLGSEISFNSGRSSYPADSTPSYEWTVDSTEQSTDENFTHSFDSPGEHPVELTVTADGAVSTDSVTITVEDRTPPVVSLVANETTPQVGDTVSFNATGSTDNDAIESYNWSTSDDTTVVDSTDGIHNITYDAPGTYRQSVTVTDPSGNENTATVKITVQGPNATTETAAVDYGTVTLGSTNTTAIEIANDGTTPLNLTEASFDDLDGPFELIGSAADSLPLIHPGSKRSLGVGFTPTTESANSTTLTIEHNATHQNDLTVDLSGTGVDSDISAEHSTYDFGSTELGDTTSQTITISNDGTTAADIDAISITGSTPDAFGIVDAGGLPGSLDSDTSTDIDVDFEPVTSGEQGATLRIEADGTVTTITLVGSGDGPEIGLPDGAVDFGELGTGENETESVRIANYGNQSLDIEDATIAGSDQSAFSVVDTPAVVGSGATEDVTVEFAPDEAGSYSGVLEIESNDPTTDTARVDLSGSAVAPRIDADPRNVDFGNVTIGETARSNITITNLHSSLSNLSVESTRLVGNDRDEFEVTDDSDAPFELAPGATRDIEIEFTPTSPGTKEAQLQIMSDAGNEPQIDIWLSNTKTYVVIQEVDADVEKDDAEVNLDARNVVAGTAFDINVSKPGSRETAMGIDTVSMNTDYEGDFEMNFTHQPTPLNHTLDIEDTTTTQYVQQAYTIDGTEFVNTSLAYRIRADSLPEDTDPESVTFYRYNTTQDAWVGHDSTLVSESTSHYVFSVDTPGFSEFAVTVPDSDGSGSPSGSSSDDQTSDSPETDTKPTEPEAEEDPESDGSEDTSIDDETSEDGGDTDDGTSESDGETDPDTDDGAIGTGADTGSSGRTVFGITLTPVFIAGFGGFSLLAAAVSALFLLGRNRSERYRIAIGSDVDDWSQIVTAVTLDERDNRDLGELVDIIAVSTHIESSLTDYQQRILAATGITEPAELTVVSFDELSGAGCNRLVWLGEPPADIDESIDVVQWPLPETGVEGSDTETVDQRLRQEVSSLLDQFE